MARILHLDANPDIRKRVCEIAVKAGHKVVGVDTVAGAQSTGGEFDLYICGMVNKYSDGLAYSLTKIEEGKNVLILSSKRKASLVPFFDKGMLKNEEAFHQALNEALKTGG
jgi:hypothetical protein